MSIDNAASTAIPGKQHMRSVTSCLPVEKSRFEWVIKDFLCIFAVMNDTDKLYSTPFGVGASTTDSNTDNTVRFRMMAKKENDSEDSEVDWENWDDDFDDDSEDNSKNFVLHVELMDFENGKDVWVEINLAVLSADGVSEWKREGPHTRKFSNGKPRLGYVMFSIKELLLREELKTASKKILPQGHLTVVCELRVWFGGIATATHTPVEIISPAFPPGPNFHADLASLLAPDPNHLSDVTLVCGNKTFPCHRIILEARSDVFKTMFEGNFTESKNEPVVITDVQPDIMATFIQACYSESISLTNDQSCLELLKAAEKYNFKHLKVICEQKMSEGLNEENAASILSWALACNAENLRVAAKKYVEKNSQKIVGTTGFADLMRVFPDALKKEETNANV